MNSGIFYESLAPYHLFVFKEKDTIKLCFRYPDYLLYREYFILPVTSQTDVPSCILIFSTTN